MNPKKIWRELLILGGELHIRENYRSQMFRYINPA